MDGKTAAFRMPKIPRLRHRLILIMNAGTMRARCGCEFWALSAPALGMVDQRDWLLDKYLEHRSLCSAARRAQVNAKRRELARAARAVEA